MVITSILEEYAHSRDKFDVLLLFCYLLAILKSDTPISFPVTVLLSFLDNLCLGTIM